LRFLAAARKVEEMRQLFAMEDTVLTLLFQKKALLLRYEQETQKILSCEIDNMAEHVNARQGMAARIDAAGAHIAQLCAQDPQVGPVALSAATNKAAMGRLPQSLMKILSEAQEISAVAARIQQADIQATDRLKQERNALRIKIEEINRSISARAARYYQTPPAQERVLLDKRYKNV
jgi:hypothetical protein